MGTIRVGKKNPKAITPNGWSTVGSGVVSSVAAVKKELSGEERERFIRDLLSPLPKEQWVSALREHGFAAEADECERSLAEEHLRELNAKARAERLAAILQLPESEQLQLLVEEGYHEYADSLRKKLSAEAAAPDEEESPSDEAPVDDDKVGGDVPAELTAAEPAAGVEGEESSSTEEAPAEQTAVAPVKKVSKPKSAPKRGVKKTK